eukprot:1700006-Prymnesium_polylepis.1
MHSPCCPPPPAPLPPSLPPPLPPLLSLASPVSTEGLMCAIVRRSTRLRPLASVVTTWSSPTTRSERAANGNVLHTVA